MTNDMKSIVNYLSKNTSLITVLKCLFQHL